MHAIPGSEGYFKYGEWLLIWVELENSGQDQKGSIEVRVPGSSGTVVYTAPVDLPTNSRKRVPIYVLPNNFSREVDVQLHSESELLAQEKVTIHPQLNNTYMIGLLAESHGALALINGAKIPADRERPLILINTSLAALPEKAEALESLDTLVINDIDTSQLTHEQKNAIELWVSQGGILVIGGGSGAQKTISGLPSSLVPFSPEGLSEIQELGELVSFSAHRVTGETEQSRVENPILVPGPFLISSGEVTGGQVLARSGDHPLVIEKQSGNGTVFFVALDLTVSPFDAWNGTTNFWENLLSPGANYPDWIPPDVSSRQQLAGQMPYTLTNLPMLDLPSTRLLVFWLVLYILLIGPVNYFILRWKKSLHLAWITIPAITLLFSIGAYGLGYALHGTDVFVNKISIIELIPGDQANTTSFIGVFSPAQRGYEIEVSGNGLISAMSPFYNPWDTGMPVGAAPGRELKLVQGEPGIVQGVSIEQWSMHSFMVEGTDSEIGSLEYSLQYHDQVLTGAIENNTGQKIKDALIFVNKSIYRLGDLEPGQEIQVEFPVSDRTNLEYGPTISYLIFQDQLNQPNPGGSPAREFEVKRQIVEALFERTPTYQFSSTSRGKSHAGVTSTPIFLGWIDESPPVVTVRNSEPGNQTTAVVVLPLEFELPQGKVVIPTGWIPGELVQTPLDGGTCGEPGTTSVYLTRGSGTFDFSIPPKFQTLQPEKIRLSLWNDSGTLQISPEIAIFDWASESWTTLSGIQAGINMIPNAAQFINHVGSARLRISASETGQGCYFLAIGLEGSIP
ncbi:MAG: hypothetical protein A2Z16_09465 [Chloroflexi bacterium RBG_16_54_18]|nr:MAG: hypothetical protein A2Z16_09465 [Chloroflexi bacterium RBG_16_54_18]